MKKTIEQFGDSTANSVATEQLGESADQGSSPLREKKQEYIEYMNTHYSLPAGLHTESADAAEY